MRKEGIAKFNIHDLPRGHVVVRSEAQEAFAQSVIEKFRSWLEATLGASLGETVLVPTRLRIDQCVMPDLFPDVSVSMNSHARKVHQEEMVERTALPEGHFPVVDFEVDILTEQDGTRKISSVDRWWLVPVAFWISGAERPLFVLPIRFFQQGDPFRPGEELINFVLVHREDLPRLSQLLERLVGPSDEKRKDIYMGNGADLSFTPCQSWDHLVLDPTVVRLIRDDFFRFLSHREWFLSRGVPFRRGYLLYGPPGNGKTSVVRAMASTPGVSVCSLYWGKRDLDDDSLSMLFRWAANHAPALVVMEDIDRHFSRGFNAEPQHRISLAHLLNCLDGLQDSEGVIVVATANHPTSLDPAILSRPGRFDRVVAFPNPNDALRERYFRMLLGEACSRNRMQQIVRLSAGLSFAQLREAFTTAAYLAFDEQVEIADRHVVQALQQLLPSLRRLDRHGRAVGFRGSAARERAIAS